MEPRSAWLALMYVTLSAESSERALNIWHADDFQEEEDGAGGGPPPDSSASPIEGTPAGGGPSDADCHPTVVVIALA